MCEELVQGGVTIVAVWLAAWLGLKGFFRQKEFELVKERYLEGAIDIVAAHYEETLGIYDHNWTRCLKVLQAFRDMKSHFDLGELQQGFLQLDLSRFDVIAHH